MAESQLSHRRGQPVQLFLAPRPTEAQRRVMMERGPRAFRQRPSRRASVAVGRRSELCEPTEDERQMSTLCQATVDNDPDGIGENAIACRDISAFGPEGCPPLHLGAHEGHVEAVHKLLALGAQLDARNVEGLTPLHMAVKSGSKEVVQILNLARADLGATDWRGKTALHHVCEYARENCDASNMAEPLLHRGADVNISDERGYTPVMLAMGNLPLLKLFIELGTKPSTYQAARYIEQCRASKRGGGVLKLLQAEGWCPPLSNNLGGISDVAADAAAATGRTTRRASLLRQAVGTGGTGQPAETLISREDLKVLGVRPHPFGSTPLHVRAKRGHADCDGDTFPASSFSRTDAGVLVRAPIADLASRAQGRDDKGRLPIHVAAASGKIDDVKYFLRATTDIHSRDNEGYTPLHSAAEAGEAPVVEALLEGGANHKLTDLNWYSALDIAVINRYQAVVEVLLAGGASPGVGGEQGPTPLHFACDNDTPDIVEILLHAGALPGHCWNDKLKSPLLVACTDGCADAVKLLLPRLSRRQINCRDRITSADEGGTTALLAAITCGRNEMDIVKALLEAGANPNIRMVSTNVSPLETVVSHENVATNPALGPRLVRALVGAGADVHGTGPQGRTALHHACHEGACGEVVQALLDAGADACAPCAGIRFLTPLQLAGCGGNPGALRVMIERPECGGLNAVGAPPERATILALAVRAGSTEGVRFLLEEGADMDLLPFEADGSTPRAQSLIHLAISEGHVDTTRLLLQARRFKEKCEWKGRWQKTSFNRELP